MQPQGSLGYSKYNTALCMQAFQGVPTTGYLVYHDAECGSFVTQKACIVPVLP